MQNKRTAEIIIEGLPYTDGKKVRIEKGKYGNGAIALQGFLLYDNGEYEPYAKFSTNLPEYTSKLGKNQTFFKVWTENEGMLEILQAANIVGPVLFKVHNGHVDVPVVEVLI